MPRKYNKTGEYSVLNESIKCELCGKECKNARSLEAHLRTGHHFSENKEYEDYYNQYLKKEGEGICPVCGKPTLQIKFKYNKCCSVSCAGKLSVSNRSYDNLPKELKLPEITDKQIRGEVEMYCNAKGSLQASPNRNKCVIKFQEDNFYKQEKELWKNNKAIRKKLVENRVKYLNKPAPEITAAEYLRGFKISRLHNSYSHFSPLWIKYFIEQNDLKYVADPFGGWGHHMIGAAAAHCKYDYNDLSPATVEGVKRMNDYFGFDYNIICGNAKDFKISDECDGVFMCPPYYNLEIYECGEFKNRFEYDSVMKRVFDNWKKSNAKVLGVIIREDLEYLFKFIGDWKSKELVNVSEDHVTKATEKINEYLYTFEK